MHTGIGHLFVNMFSLYFVGSFVEKLIGRKRYLKFYIISGIFAGLFFSFFAYYFGDSLLTGRIFGTPDTLAVGASGAIFGLIGILAILVPRVRVYLIGGPLIAIILQSIIGIFVKNSGILGILDVIITFYFIFSLMIIFSRNYRMRRLAIPIELPFWLAPIVAIIPLVIIGLFVSLPIGNMAHLGGLLVGLIYGAYLKRRYKKRIMLLNKMINQK